MLFFWDKLLTQRYRMISLGYFCSVALELQREGMRDASYPFDWVISDWFGVQKLIKNHFDGFLDYDKLYQDKQYPQYYSNTTYGISFYHDFSPYIPLAEQLNFVKNKYERRIERFYQDIGQPTLFLRYIATQAERDDIICSENEFEILLKSYNKENRILFIINDDLSSPELQAFAVKKDENDRVARQFLEKNRKLLKYLRRFYPKRERRKNLKVPSTQPIYWGELQEGLIYRHVNSI